MVIPDNIVMALWNLYHMDVMGMDGWMDVIYEILYPNLRAC